MPVLTLTQQIRTALHEVKEEEQVVPPEPSELVGAQQNGDAPPEPPQMLLAWIEVGGVGGVGGG